MVDILDVYTSTVEDVRSPSSTANLQCIKWV